MKSVFILSALVLNLFFANSSFAIPEANYAAEYQAKVVPFMAEHAQPFTFNTFDGHALSAVKIIHPNAVGTIVVLEGRSEPWLKYSEFFYDLYQQGYSIYAYDHRGQGLSPHLSAWNPQVGHVYRFQNYVLDLGTFLDTVVKPAMPASEKLFLIAHSMGGAIATSYLEQNASPFAAVVLNSPMLQINTHPYPESIALAIVKLATTFGFGNRYAIGYHNYNPDLPFSSNTVTRSEARFEMTKEVYAANPKAVLGGPSSRWVYESITGTHVIQAAASSLSGHILMLQAGHDQLVVVGSQTQVCEAAKDCHLIKFDDSEHEILMERDTIRNHALNLIIDFFR